MKIKAKGMKDEVKIVLCKGVEGNSIYIDNHRICGPKPWGGGKIIQEWTGKRRDVLEALNLKQEADDGE